MEGRYGVRCPRSGPAVPTDRHPGRGGARLVTDDKNEVPESQAPPTEEVGARKVGKQSRDPNRKPMAKVGDAVRDTLSPATKGYGRFTDKVNANSKWAYPLLALIGI